MGSNIRCNSSRWTFYLLGRRRTLGSSSSDGGLRFLLLSLKLLLFWTTDVAHFDISACDGVLGVTVANGCFLLLLLEVAVALVELVDLLSGVVIIVILLIYCDRDSL